MPTLDVILSQTSTVEPPKDADFFAQLRHAKKEVQYHLLTACGVDSNRFTGFAFGMGIDRTLMFRHGVEDLRDLFEGDVRLTAAFGTEI